MTVAFVWDHFHNPLVVGSLKEMKKEVWQGYREISLYCLLIRKVCAIEEFIEIRLNMERIYIK